MPSNFRPILLPSLLALLAFPWQIAGKALFIHYAPMHLREAAYTTTPAASLLCLVLSLPGIVSLVLAFLLIARRKNAISNLHLVILLVAILVALSSTTCAVCDFLIAPANPHAP
ncbi:MAG TPA: hypothetical protein VHM90_06255 [Phycisphaerae bacterium]|nr:hypothetical protein [Phycisphaerae bacterium]